MIKRDFHKQVRVVYRACRKIYGTEKTQDECLRVFKIVFPEIFKLRQSEEDVVVLPQEVSERIVRVMEGWKAEGALKVLVESIQNMLDMPFGWRREDLIQFYEDITPVVMRIRKLTPRECGRLQGCDEMTIDVIEDCGVSKSAQYKMYGNSITVDVLFHLFRKLLIDTDVDITKGKPQQLSLF